MTARRGRVVVLALIPLLCPCACRQEAQQPKPPPPAKVEKLPGEGDLVAVTLTADAVLRLGIETGVVERRSVERARTLGGEVVVPDGAAVTVTAPLAGTLSLPAGQAAPSPDAAVARGQAVLTLMPLLSPESRVTFAASATDADGAVRRATVQVEAAEVAFARTEKLLAEQAGSVRAVDEARAALDLAEATREGAVATRDAIGRAIVDLESQSVAPITIPAPIDGVLRRISAAEGQRVAAGAALFEVFRADPVWIRVPVYAGDLDSIDPARNARVSDLAARPGSPAVEATPCRAPPSASPDAATVDLYYEAANEDRALRPGQRVAVTLALRGAEDSLTVPWSAVLYDVNGGAWVYLREAPLTFVRRRVEVRHVAQDLAVLGRGPDPGAAVVTAGAAELFGTEFGGGK